MVVCLESINPSQFFHVASASSRSLPWQGPGRQAFPLFSAHSFRILGRSIAIVAQRRIDGAKFGEALSLQIRAGKGSSWTNCLRPTPYPATASRSTRLLPSFISIRGCRAVVRALYDFTRVWAGGTGFPAHSTWAVHCKITMARSPPQTRRPSFETRFSRKLSLDLLKRTQEGSQPDFALLLLSRFPVKILAWSRSALASLRLDPGPDPRPQLTGACCIFGDYALMHHKPAAPALMSDHNGAQGFRPTSDEMASFGPWRTLGSSFPRLFPRHSLSIPC